MPGLVAPESFPGKTASLTASIEPLHEHSVHTSGKALQGPAVVGHPKILEVAAHLASDRLPEVGQFARVALFVYPVINIH
jgi:hypothetical protein